MTASFLNAYFLSLSLFLLAGIDPGQEIPSASLPIGGNPELRN
jgi:hypothetical protein|tara:strand:- start:4974 stop:5102 length:129 start_codon:yes stop_codon:yes gene_type:complete